LPIIATDAFDTGPTKVQQTAHAGNGAAGFRLVTAHGTLCKPDSQARIYSLLGGASPKRGDMGAPRPPNARQSDLAKCRSLFTCSVQHRGEWDSSRDASTGDHQQGQRGDNVRFRRSPFWFTPRCPRIVSVSGKNRRSPHLSWVDPRVEIGGGSDAPAVEHVDRSLVDVCPLRGRRSPLAASRSWRTNLRDCVEPPELEERQPLLRNCDCARSDRDRTGVLGRVKVPRASRAAVVIGSRDLDAASARPRDGNYRSEPEP
jgi:hypothetical protein